jgi:hypothetical protein
MDIKKQANSVAYDNDSYRLTLRRRRRAAIL